MIDATGYDSTPMKSEPLYTIDNDNAIFPITIKYTLCTPLFGTLTNKDFQGLNYNVLIEKFITNEDMLFDWFSTRKYSSTGFKIIETKCIQVLKYEDGRILDFDISSNILFNEDETVNMILSHPSFQTLKERAEEIAKKNEEDGIKEFNSRRKTIKENMYLNWKHLNKKYLLGEFKEFEEADVNV
jgi:hypothetical protein